MDHFKISSPRYCGMQKYPIEMLKRSDILSENVKIYKSLIGIFFSNNLLCVLF